MIIELRGGAGRVHHGLDHPERCVCRVGFRAHRAQLRLHHRQDLPAADRRLEESSGSVQSNANLARAQLRQRVAPPVAPGYIAQIPVIQSFGGTEIVGGEAEVIAALPASTGIAARLSEYLDRKSTRLNSSHVKISYAVFCLKKKKTDDHTR